MDLDRRALAEEAVIWGFPLVLAGRYLRLAQAKQFPFNRFYHNPHLATPSLKIVGPNIDTLYGLAWLDLTTEPQVIAVPDTADRYYSIQLCDMYLTTFMYIGPRTTGTKAGAFAITGPGWSGTLPAGVTQIKAPTSRILAVARTLVRGDDDLNNAQAVQANYAIGPLSAYPTRQVSAVAQENALGLLPAIELADSGIGFFDELCTLLAKYPPTSADAAALSRYASIGLHPSAAPSRASAASALLAAAVKPGIERIRATKFFVEKVGYWSTNSKVRDYVVADPLMRASINFLGPAWHLAPEALYFSTTEDGNGNPLTGGQAYTVRFANGALPPVDAFWSVTMYGELFSLVENPLRRYSINTFTQGLQFERNGALVLHIRHDQPPSGPGNWLPSPNHGNFMVFIRTYQPHAALIDGSYRLPAIMPA